MSALDTQLELRKVDHHTVRVQRRRADQDLILEVLNEANLDTNVGVAHVKLHCCFANDIERRASHTSYSPPSVGSYLET